jgi:hypothetical protein
MVGVSSVIVYRRLAGETQEIRNFSLNRRPLVVVNESEVHIFLRSRLYEVRRF